ncbi:MAG: MraY family glycosyltransferase [bacterium]|nr:MraY family glycosyltransferase [bacterium]
MKEIYALIVSFLISFLVTIPTIFFAKKFHLVTDKSKRFHPAHTHIGILPRGGGIPVFIAIFLTTLLFLPISKIIVGILIGAFLLTSIGVLDDYKDVSPYIRFGINILISAIVISFGLGIPYLSNPFGGIIRLDTWQIPIHFFGNHTIWVIADILAIIWLTWTTNMINWSKGVDGQLPGFVAIACIFLGIVSQRFTAHDISAQNVALLSFVVAGAYLGFLPFNFYPQKILPGYGAGALAGFMLGILSILSFGKLGTLVLILAIPLIDATYTILRRLKNHQSPFRADWGHFHHRLMEIGWGKRRIALFYWFVTFILGISSLFLSGLEKIIAFITTAGLLLMFMLIMEKMKKLHNMLQ